MAEVPARTPESDAMSKDLLKRGFRFVGSTICYAHMQATGMVTITLLIAFDTTSLKSSRAGTRSRLSLRRRRREIALQLLSYHLH